MQRQAALGIDIVCDGEISKYAYATYARERMAGLEDQPLALSELAEFPTFAQRIKLDIKTPACIGPVSYRGEQALAMDIETLQTAVAAVDVEAAFMSTSSPGIMALYMPNQHYPSQDDYLDAPADANARSGHFRPQPLSVGDFRKEVGRLVDVLNHALRDIPPDRMRCICAGATTNHPTIMTSSSPRFSI